MKRMKNIEIALLSGLLIALLTGAVVSFADDCSSLRQDVLRLHILANSDQPMDQQLKLEVRDEILRVYGSELSCSGSKAQAERQVTALLPQIEETARGVLQRQGFDDPVSAGLVHMYFETRTYGDVTMPAGMYDAVRVTIGRAQGHNWWCVLYPPVCVPAADGEDAARLAGTTVAGENPRFEPRFKIVEWIEEIKSRLDGEKRAEMTEG